MALEKENIEITKDEIPCYNPNKAACCEEGYDPNWFQKALDGLKGHDVQPPQFPQHVTDEDMARLGECLGGDIY